MRAAADRTFAGYFLAAICGVLIDTVDPWAWIAFLIAAGYGFTYSIVFAVEVIRR